MPDLPDSNAHSLKGRLTALRGHRHDAIAPSDAVEPCLGCGEETAVGSVLFGQRHSFDRAAAGQAFLCDECYARIRTAKHGTAPTESDLEVIAGNGVMIAAGFFSGH
jgi:hypothetical protein